MFEGGVLEEVRNHLHEQRSPTANQMLGLQDVREYLSGQTSLETCHARIVTATRQYAKRQTTWFKREVIFHSINLTHLDKAQQLAQIQIHFQRWRACSMPGMAVNRG